MCQKHMWVISNISYEHISITYSLVLYISLTFGGIVLLVVHVSLVCLYHGQLVPLMQFIHGLILHT